MKCVIQVDQCLTTFVVRADFYAICAVVNARGFRLAGEGILPEER